MSAGLCTCNASDGKVETLVAAAVNDSLAPFLDIGDHSITEFNSLAFACTLAGVHWTSASCVNESNVFFDKQSVTTTIQATTAVLYFNMEINNVDGISMTSDCILQLNAMLVLRATADKGR